MIRYLPSPPVHSPLFCVVPSLFWADDETGKLMEMGEVFEGFEDISQWGHQAAVVVLFLSLDYGIASPDTFERAVRVKIVVA
jgi:hypothetical protein